MYILAIHKILGDDGMKAAFFHDTPLVCRHDGQVCSIGFTYNIWERYLKVFDSLVVSTRMRFDNNENHFMKKGMSLSSGPKVKFTPISKYVKKTDMILKRKEITDQIRIVLQQCDCAIIRLPSFIGEIACKEAEVIGKPYLIEVVGCPWDSLWNHSVTGKIVAPFMYFRTKRSVLNASHVIYVTNKYLQNKYPTHGENISCSDVVLQEFDNRIITNRFSRISNRDKNDKIIIGTTASVDVRYKGQQYVIHALGKLKNKGITNFKFQLVGGGDQSYLKSIAKKHGVIDQVEFLGAMPHNKVINWLDNIDIYIQPSITEGLPRALIEAMSRGAPAIGSNAGGIPELLDDIYIIKNINKSVDHISNILESFDIDNMRIQAIRNFEESKKYDINLIENNRKKFLEEFKKHVENIDKE